MAELCVGKSGLYVSLAEYLNSCIGSESSELPFLASPVFRGKLKFANSPSVSSTRQAVSAYCIFWSGIYAVFFIILFQFRLYKNIDCCFFSVLRYNHLAIHDFIHTDIVLD